MKARFLIIFALVFVSHFAWSQQQRPEGGERPNKEAMAELKASLQLTKVQKKQWKIINKDFKSQAQALKEKEGDSKEKRMGMKGLNDAKDAQLKGMLTSEQWATYEAHKAAKKTERKGGQRPPRGGQ